MSSQGLRYSTIKVTEVGVCKIEDKNYDAQAKSRKDTLRLVFHSVLPRNSDKAALKCRKMFTNFTTLTNTIRT